MARKKSKLQSTTPVIVSNDTAVGAPIPIPETLPGVNNGIVQLVKRTSDQANTGGYTISAWVTHNNNIKEINDDANAFFNSTDNLHTLTNGLRIVDDNKDMLLASHVKIYLNNLYFAVATDIAEIITAVLSSSSLMNDYYTRYNVSEIVETYKRSSFCPAVIDCFRMLSSKSYSEAEKDIARNYIISHYQMLFNTGTQSFISQVFGEINPSKFIYNDDDKYCEDGTKYSLVDETFRLYCLAINSCVSYFQSELFKDIFSATFTHISNMLTNLSEIDTDPLYKELEESLTPEK